MQRKLQPQDGFTLIELLVVIVVIAILMGLLLVALGPVSRTARNFAITSEINQLEGAIEQFKTKFGFYPPCEIADDDTFKQYLRRVAPNHEETPAQITAWFSAVGSNLDNDSILVFWLSGLNRSAQYPLTYGLGTDTTYGTVDDVFTGFAVGEDPAKHIFFEFNGAQLVDGNSATVKRYLQRKVGDQPYVYFDSQRYATSTCSVTDVDASGSSNTHPIYAYRANPTNATSPYYNPATFQIIAAGVDRVFGAVGGPAPADDWTAKLAAPSLVNFNYHRDNITNFSGGILERETQ